MNDTHNIFTVGVGDAKITRAPHHLKTLLGSCIGIVLYDPIAKVGGILHIMLPKKTGNDSKLTKYADTGLPFFIAQLIKNGGASKSAMQAKIFGGAKMFETAGNLINIGEKNEQEVRKILKEEGIKIVAAKTGGTKGYNILLDTATGSVECRIFGEPISIY